MAASAILGYFIVHPSLMVLGHLMFESFPPGHSVQKDVIELFYLSFSISMVPWAISAVIFSAIIGLLYAKNRQFKQNIMHSNRMKDLYNDIITHDLLNPTGAILNSVELINDESVTFDKKLLEIIESSAKEQEKIIDNSMELSKLQNLEKLDKNSHNLRDIIEKAIDDTSHLFEAQDIMVENKVTESVPLLVNQVIISVFHNILSNAAKHSPKKSTVVIEIENNKENCIVSVSDRGEGIPDKYKKTLFDRFARREKEGVKGTGLGLAIANRIVEMHGGRVWVEDNPDGGSAFKVKLMKDI